MSAVRYEVYDANGGFVQDGVQFGVACTDPEMAAMEVVMGLDLPAERGWSIRAWMEDQSGRGEPDAVLTMK